MLVCSAIKLYGYNPVSQTYQNDGLIICGRRHADCFSVLTHFEIRPKLPQIEQGFMTSDGKFLNRSIAKEYAVMRGQLPSSHTGTLFSEDLWRGEYNMCDLTINKYTFLGNPVEIISRKPFEFDNILTIRLFDGRETLVFMDDLKGVQ